LESERELAPVEVAQKSGIKHTTVKVYLRELMKEGKIVQPYHGTYCGKVTHGMMFAPLRTHNVVLSSETCWLDFSDDVVEQTGGVKVRVQFGLERRKITGTLSCDDGMDRNCVLFALNRFFDIVRVRTGRELDMVTVKTFEVNRDVQGVRLDGVKCYTKKGLFQTVERLYQKEEDVVRYEHKVSTPMKVDEFVALLQGGVSSYNMQQGLYALIQEQKALVESVKGNNWQILKITEAMEKLTGKVHKEPEGLDKFVHVRSIKKQPSQRNLVDWMV
jgi:hypothetical protein